MPENRRLDDLDLCPAQFFHNSGNSGDRRLLRLGIAHDPTFADLTAANFKLRLHQQNQLQCIA